LVTRQTFADYTNTLDEKENKPISKFKDLNEASKNLIVEAFVEQSDQSQHKHYASKTLKDPK